MLDIKYSARYVRDYKRCKKRGYDLEKLRRVISTLSIPALLPRQNNDHKLAGDFLGYRECHVAPDWVLVYRYANGCLELYCTGTHADIFGL